MKLQWGNTAEKLMTWQEASDYCKKLGKGWRLPTIQELTSCINYEKHNPASGMDFKNDYYWSSTTYVYYTDYAWLVSFGSGSVDYGGKTGSLYVRPVRGGQCFGNLKINKSDIKVEAVKMLKSMIGKMEGNK